MQQVLAAWDHVLVSFALVFDQLEKRCFHYDLSADHCPDAVRVVLEWLSSEQRVRWPE